MEAMPPPQPPMTDEDCNLPSQERLTLLERLQTLLGNVPPHFWAACHLCDLQKLELLVKHAELNKNIVITTAGITYRMVATWNQSISGSASAGSTPRSSPTLQRLQLQGSPQDGITPPAKRQKTSFSRSKSARDSAERRDNSHCVLTGSSRIEVAHIYPFFLLAKEEDKFGKRHVFWHMLKNFWPKEKITTWEAAVFPDGTEECGLETARNMITLSSDAHRAWNKGEFALKPISLSEDERTLTIQFFWQAKEPLMMPTISLTTSPISTRHLDTGIGGGLGDFSQNEVRRLVSGDLFKLTTDDPEARPLPSLALLEMQWFLQRVMGMAGAADELKDNDYHFSDPGAYSVAAVEFSKNDYHFSDPGEYYEEGDYISNSGEFDEDEGDISNLGLDECGDETLLSNVTELSDPIIPDNTNALPSIEPPKHSAEQMEEIPGDEGIM